MPIFEKIDWKRKKKPYKTKKWLNCLRSTKSLNHKWRKSKIWETIYLTDITRIEKTENITRYKLNSLIITIKITYQLEYVYLTLIRFRISGIRINLTGSPKINIRIITKEKLKGILTYKKYSWLIRKYRNFT